MEPVHFNTNFFYRFGSDGVVSFGGEEDGLFDTDVVTWTENDIPIANAALKDMKERLNLPEVNIASYDKNKAGTEKLLAELVVRGGVPNEYLMGCVICHQLQYKVPLEAFFLTGQPSRYDSDCDSCNDENPYYEAESSSEYDSE
jgi:hypothetical protein